MTPLPGALGGKELLGWRIDRAHLAPAWDSGSGAEVHGGRWNVKGTRAVYCSIDPACAIVEVAAHRGFKVLDTEPHVLTRMVVTNLASVHIVDPAMVPNAAWLRPGTPSFGQQQLGSALLAQHGIVLFPSAVSTFSWNLVFDPVVAKGRYAMKAQHAFEMDTRLHPAP